MSEQKLSKADLNYKETLRQIATMVGSYDESDEHLHLKQKFTELARSTNRLGVDLLLLDLDQKKDYGLTFWNQPASTKYHGSEMGGLVRHCLEVYNQLKVIKQYSGEKVNIPEDSLILCALFHDLCKWHSYTFNITPKTKELSSQTFMWDNHLPLGHGDMSVMVLQRYIELTPLEQMLIRWHMGPFDKTYWENQQNIEKYYPQCRYLFIADYWSAGIEGGDE